MRLRRALFVLSALAPAMLFPMAGPLQARAADVTAFAAASTAGLLTEIAALWKARTGATVRVAFGSSGALARQIEAGAPAELFLSASVAWVDYLVEKKAVRPDTRFTVFRNGLVLIAPAGSAATAAIDPATGTYAALAGGNRLALGDPRHVPAGIYARQALESLGIWTATEPRTARMQDVRLALALVERGEAALGIVYRTDAAPDRRVRIVAGFAPELHQPIEYVAVATPAAGDAALSFLDFLKTPPAAALVAWHGFIGD